jgi:hypothetical protein
MGGGEDEIHQAESENPFAEFGLHLPTPGTHLNPNSP